jgi:RNA polymerase sigma-70 factor (ECF subfamily)
MPRIAMVKAPAPRPDDATPAPDRVDRAATSLQLLSRARQGDRSALNELFARHVPWLQRWAHGRLGAWARSAMDTADLVQDAVLQTFRRLDHFEPRGQNALRAYLRQAIQNRISDEYRRVMTRGVQEELSDASLDPRPSPYDAFVNTDAEERYRRALLRLKGEDRELIVGRIELGYSHEQLATLTGRRSPDAARMALKRALLKLTDEMGRPIPR